MKRVFCILLAVSLLLSVAAFAETPAEGLSEGDFTASPGDAAEDEEGNHAPYSHSDQLMNASKDDLVEEFEKHEIFKEGANYMKQYLDYMKEQEQEVVAQA